MSVVFLTDPTIERAPRGRYRLVTPLVVVADGETYVVPHGFTFDGASIPTPFWSLISHPMAPSSLRPAVFHDWGCCVHPASSATVHRWFAEALLSEGCAKFRTWLMGKAVAWFGPKFRMAQPAKMG